MSQLESLIYTDANNEKRLINFKGETKAAGHHTTLLTGENGTYKSTILRDIVRGIVGYSQVADSVLKVTASGTAHRVLAISGAISDRYPAKENAGRSTEFAVPSYVYFGQRVGGNLISKRQILETLTYHILDEAVADRFAWPFFARVFEMVGLIPQLELTIENPSSQNRKNRTLSRPLFDVLSSIATGREAIDGRAPFGSPSRATADFLLNQFDYSTFGELHSYLSGTRRKATVTISDRVESSGLSSEAIRLGLYADELRLKNAEVSSRRRRSTFSAFELSSGEYQVLSTLLAVGFALRNGDILLVDEPENSLHPQWQIEYMRILFEISSFMDDGHVLISTHSPLIVSSAKLDSTIVDLSKNGTAATEPKQLTGASADDILLDHFGLASSRNYALVETVQNAIALIENERDNTEEFIALLPRLANYRESLSPTDPLIEIIDALINEDQE